MPRVASTNRAAVITAQNIAKYSDSLQTSSSGAWDTVHNALVTGDQLLNPITGGMTMDLMSDDNANTYHEIAQNVSTTPVSGVFTYSAVVKSKTARWICLGIQAPGASVYFDILNGVLGTYAGAGYIGHTITAIQDYPGYYFITFTFSADTMTQIQFYTATTNGGVVYQGASAISFYAGSVQLVRGYGIGVYTPSPTAAIDTGTPRLKSVEQNLLKYSEDLSQSVWTKNTGVVATANSSDVPPPFEGASVSKVVYTTGAGAGQYRFVQNAAINPPTPRARTAAIWLRTAARTATLDLYANGTNFTRCNVTTDWQLFSVTSVASSTTVMQLYDAQADAPFTIYASAAQFSFTDGVIPYVKTTNTSVNITTPRNPYPRVQNLVPYSQQLNLICSTVGATISPDTTDTLDPWGTNTADVLVEDGSTGTHRLQILGGISSNIGAMQTLSVYVKAGTRTRTYVQNSVNESITVDLTDGSIVSYVGGIDRGVIDEKNGWWRIWTTFISPASSSSLYVYAYNGGFSYTGTNGSKALYVTGMQYVNANWPGPYAQTGASVINTGNIRNRA